MANKQTQTKPSKKLSCRRRCARWCRRCCCNRIKRCINKKIFGVPDPVTNVQLHSKLKLNATGSIFNIIKNAIQRKDSRGALKDFSVTDVVAGELKRKYSIRGSKEKVLNNMIIDYKQGKLSISKLQTSKLDINTLDKKQIHNMLRDYENAQKEKYADLNADDLKNKFSVKKSQEKILDKLVDDLKKGKLSAAAISNTRYVDPKKLDQDKLNSLLQKYQARPSFVAEKFSIKGSKRKLLEHFMQDHKKGKFSATKFTSKTGFDPNKLNKSELNNLLKKYDAEQKARPLFSDSKGFQKILQDLRSFQNHPSLIDLAKKNLPGLLKH